MSDSDAADRCAEDLTVSNIEHVFGSEVVGADRAGRLERARGLLRSAEAAGAGASALARAEAGDRTLPVAAPFARLLPGGGLRRGGTLALGPGAGATSLLFALLAEASAAGAWTAVVGRPDLGLVAAAEAGVRLERLALVADPGGDLLAVTAALLDGVDLVAVAVSERARIGAADRQRLAARARQRGAVLLALGPWPGADVELHCADARWAGVERGAGRLASRTVRVRLHGRGAGPGGRAIRALLPGPAGGVLPAVERPAGPVPVRVAG